MVAVPDPEHSIAQRIHDRLACIRMDTEEALRETQQWLAEAEAEVEQ